MIVDTLTLIEWWWCTNVDSGSCTDCLQVFKARAGTSKIEKIHSSDIIPQMNLEDSILHGYLSSNIGHGTNSGLAKLFYAYL